MRKFGMILALLCILITLLPGAVMATTYNNDVPSGLTLSAWTVGPNQGGKNTVISFLYTGGFRASNEIDAPFDSSWHSLDDVRPILLAEQEGYGNYLGGTNGTFGSNIKFSDNVLAAMKVQNFNPSQVGGANIPPSSTTLNSDQTSWLQKMGYSVQSTNQTVPTQTQAPTPAPVTQSQTQNNPPSQSTSSKQSSSATVMTAQQSKANTSISPVQSDPAVGQTVKTPSGPMTQEMVAADKILSTQNPPSSNPANIPTKLPIKEETQTQKNIWLWVAAAVTIFAFAAVAGRMIYVRHRVA
ncbi:hypothetical protein Desaci_4102 [Desulfosporosinus acidiphilus SJ4]|uniref:Uncharacterized protein n=2 Tax=Desulfosporosinus TaxID=79206 RepID=I4DAZ1_DESAJ|nr:hypothetical protein Desaci_4102 [Desulfosporosinus acidiphilus SJ4]